MELKCLRCDDVVMGDGKGSCLTCSCGELTVDETPYYCKVNCSDLDMVLDMNAEKTLAELQENDLEESSNEKD